MQAKVVLLQDMMFEGLEGDIIRPSMRIDIQADHHQGIKREEAHIVEGLQHHPTTEKDVAQEVQPNKDPKFIHNHLMTAVPQKALKLPHIHIH